MHNAVIETPSFEEYGRNPQTTQKFKGFLNSKLFNFFITIVNKVAFQKFSVKGMSLLFDHLRTEWILLEEISHITLERRKKLLATPSLHPNFSFHLALRSLYWYSGSLGGELNDKAFSPDLYALTKVKGDSVLKIAEISVQAIFKIDDLLNMPPPSSDFQVPQKDLICVKELLFKKQILPKEIKHLIRKSKYLQQMLWVDNLSLEMKDYIARLYAIRMANLEHISKFGNKLQEFEPKYYNRLQIVNGKSRRDNNGKRESPRLNFVENLKRVGLWDAENFRKEHEVEDDIRNLFSMFMPAPNMPSTKNKDELEAGGKKADIPVSKAKNNRPKGKLRYPQKKRRYRKVKESDNTPPVVSTVEVIPEEISQTSETVTEEGPPAVPESEEPVKSKKKKPRRKNIGRIKGKNKTIDPDNCDDPLPESAASVVIPFLDDNPVIDTLIPVGKISGRAQHQGNGNKKKVQRLKMLMEKNKKKKASTTTPPKQDISDSHPERPSILDVSDEVIHYNPPKKAINAFNYTSWSFCRDQFKIYDAEFLCANHIFVSRDNYMQYKEDIFRGIAESDVIVFDGERKGGSYLESSRLEFGILCLKQTLNGILEMKKIYTIKGSDGNIPLSEKNLNSMSSKTAKSSNSTSSSGVVASLDFSQIAKAIISRKNLKLLVFNGLFNLIHLFKIAGMDFVHNQEFLEKHHPNLTIIDAQHISEKFIEEGVVKGVASIERESLIKHFKIESSLQSGTGRNAFLTWQLYESLVNSFLFNSNFWMRDEFCPIEEIKRYYGKLSGVSKPLKI